MDEVELPGGQQIEDRRGGERRQEERRQEPRRAMDRSRTRAYQFCYSRPPAEKEIKNAQKFLEDYSQKQGRRSTWAALCQALFASAEFSHR